ncbi:MAG: dTDP-4-dehydrorhamnose reductase [candidate division WS6 bacterium 34_10]|uniref:dTDP-4-dehydrorhamnose reductase n=1 Tax=candidate division WS6 bacterium 34_10 TaxID=1641389 RepID=A0A101HGP6_9BACT|nr:MAG: dTDP-4-dehydrorhamnose reductase [candidate division WS6 bacterium 34_10]
MVKKKVLVFGSSGMLGSYFCNLLEEKYPDFEVIRNDKADGGVDITEEPQVREAIYDNEVDFVVNCAAYTDVNGAEENPEIAFKVNADAPKYMAQACHHLNIPFIHISTDYVFGDNREKGYPEDYDEFNPLNVYGVSKLEGEENVLGIKGDNYIFRTSWLFGPGATNFIDKISKYARELPELKVVTDEVGCPTYVRDLSEGMILALKGEVDPGIYHVCSRDSLSRYEFAKEILKLQGIDTPIREAKLEDFERKAQVPHISILLNTKLDEARTSTEMLEEYFKGNK